MLWVNSFQTLLPIVIGITYYTLQNQHYKKVFLELQSILTSNEKYFGNVVMVLFVLFNRAKVLHFTPVLKFLLFALRQYATSFLSMFKAADRSNDHIPAEKDSSPLSTRHTYLDE